MAAPAAHGWDRVDERIIWVMSLRLPHEVDDTHFVNEQRVPALR
jgi:hypothetical protein